MMDDPVANVLLIDDEESICIGVTDLLETYGYMAEYANSAEDGLRYLKSHPETDIVLLDINLGPGMGGVEALSAIKQNQKYCQVIMLTSLTSVEVGVSCMKQGAFDYMSKPFDEERFFQMVPKALEKKRFAQLSDLYLGILVHDLKNPLSKITLGIDFFKATANQDFTDKQKKMFSVIDAGLWEIKNMIGNILNVNRFEQKSIALRSERFSLKDLSDGLLAMFKDHTVSSGKEIKVRFWIDEGYILRQDRELFEQVLGNILINALRYCPKKQVVHLDFSEKERQLKVAITNPGSYISDSERDGIFEKYFNARPENRDKANRNFGLGLTYSKMAVEAMGGSIRVDGEASPPTTTFKFTVPNKEA